MFMISYWNYSNTPDKLFKEMMRSAYGIRKPDISNKHIITIPGTRISTQNISDYFPFEFDDNINDVIILMKTATIAFRDKTEQKIDCSNGFAVLKQFEKVY